MWDPYYSKSWRGLKLLTNLIPCHAYLELLAPDSLGYEGLGDVTDRLNPYMVDQVSCLGVTGGSRPQVQSINMLLPREALKPNPR